MILLVYFTSFLLGVDLACGSADHCNLDHHIQKHEGEWRFTSNMDYKGAPAEGPAMQRLNYETESEKGINQQINRELFAHYSYMSMAVHFDREDINLPGFHKFFKESSEEELKHAHLMMEYQNKRGGRVKLLGLKKPCKDHWGSGLDAMEDALKLERYVYQSLLDLHNTAASDNDPQLQDFLESNFLGEQVDSIKQLSNFVGTLTRMNGTSYSLGEYQFDRMTLGGGDEKA